MKGSVIRWSLAALLILIPTNACAQPVTKESRQRTCTDFTGLGPPSWSVQNRIAFTGDCGGRQALYVLDAADGSLTELPTGGLAAEWPRWSHSAKEIAFTVVVNEGQRDIFLLDVSSGKTTRLTDDGSHGGTMSWSPDDQWLGIYGPTGDDWNISRLRRDGSEKVRINRDNDHRYFNITWSPDGESYLYSASKAIFRQHNAAGKPVRVTPEGIHAVMPHWSPNGKLLAFDGNAGDGWELYLIKPDGTGLTRLTTNDTVDMNASWSPDGKRIAYQCDDDGVTSLCIHDLATRQSEPLFQP